MYARLYRNGAYLPKSYQREVLDLVAEAKQRHGLTERERRFREVAAEQDSAEESDHGRLPGGPQAQLSLL